MNAVKLIIQTCKDVRQGHRERLADLYLPHALQMVCPASSLLQSGVMVVPQFWHAITTVVFWFWMCNAPMSIGAARSSAVPSGCGLAVDDPLWHFSTFRLAVFEMRLLYAGQPLHPSAPPVPLHLPPPGHDPVGVWSAAT